MVWGGDLGTGCGSFVHRVVVVVVCGCAKVCEPRPSHGPVGVCERSEQYSRSGIYYIILRRAFFFLLIAHTMAVTQEQLQAVFADFDADGSGRISIKELYKAMHQAGKKVGIKEVSAMLKEIDENHDGQVRRHYVSVARLPRSHNAEHAAPRGACSCSLPQCACTR